MTQQTPSPSKSSPDNKDWVTSLSLSGLHDDEGNLTPRGKIITRHMTSWRSALDGTDGLPELRAGLQGMELAFKLSSERTKSLSKI